MVARGGADRATDGGARRREKRLDLTDSAGRDRLCSLEATYGARAFVQFDRLEDPDVRVFQVPAQRGLGGTQVVGDGRHVRIATVESDRVG